MMICFQFLCSVLRTIKNVYLDSDPLANNSGDQTGSGAETLFSMSVLVIRRSC